jgi:STE24 endopeptidase
LLAVGVPFLVRLVALVLNLRAFSPAPPADLADIYDGDAYAKSQAYARESARIEIVELVFGMAALLAFWLAGGFGWLGDLVARVHPGEVQRGLAGFALVFVAVRVFSLPFSIYDTFVIERKFGFNRTTWPTFVSDRLKGLVLAALLGLPLAALVLWFFVRTPHAWLWSWLVMAGFSLVLTFVAPKWIFPLFNTFTPLPDGELKSAIHNMAGRCQFPIGEISVIDGSRRSTKANAFFAGFGRNKRIALFDTLIEKHTVPELVAVLAHEIGHFKLGHIWQMLAGSLFHSAFLLFLLGWTIRDPRFFAAFGVSSPSVWMGFVLFGIISPALVMGMAVIQCAVSRRNEFQADRFARRVTGGAQPMIDALKKLAHDHLENLTPHPMFVALHYSHPPLRDRLAALSGPLEIIGCPGDGTR